MAILTALVFCSTVHSTDHTMKKAFTLIELLVVIGIIAILAGILIASLSGGTESARAARCLTNMKNLANACSAYALSCGYYPLAGSVEKKGLDGATGGSVAFKYTELAGWVSWDSKSATYPAPSSLAESGWFTSAYNTDRDTRLYALHHGAIWRGVAATEDVFVCPVHARLMRKNNPIWSYVMNEEFGYADNLEIPKGNKYFGKGYGINRADRTLLFSELQFLTVNGRAPNVSTSAGYENDCTLQYKKHGEVIGVNHPLGKKGLCAHLAFADGHVEKLTIPASHGSAGWRIDCELKDLTELLCKGKDFERSGSTYKESSK